MSVDFLAGGFLTDGFVTDGFVTGGLLTDSWAYGGLFASALAAAALLPTASEGVLLGLAASARFNIWALLMVASLGNVLGACINWALGRWIASQARPGKPRSQQVLARARRWYDRWGAWSLLFSWLPVIGDPLTVVAGYLRLPFWRFLLPVAIGKVGRYLAVLGLADLAFR
jgi:membrane protein YqaA with SNARE-associated domain